MAAITIADHIGALLLSAGMPLSSAWEASGFGVFGLGYRGEATSALWRVLGWIGISLLLIYEFLCYCAVAILISYFFLTLGKKGGGKSSATAYLVWAGLFVLCLSGTASYYLLSTNPFFPWFFGICADLVGVLLLLIGAALYAAKAQRIHKAKS